MLAAERQAMIVELIRENGSVQVDELARELNVSSMTIRRDLVKLENSNMMSSQDSNIQEEMLQEMYLTVHKENKSFYSLKEERKLQQLIRESIYLWRYAAERNGQSVRQICYRDVKGLSV